MKQIPSFIIILVPFHFLEVHLLGPMNYRIMPGACLVLLSLKKLRYFSIG